MNEEITQEQIDEELVKWVVGTVEPWERYREQNYDSDWKVYYKEWRGIWEESDKTRESERSRFISPALSQAVEMAVSEMEEATFSRKYWIDIDDDLADEQKQDAEMIRKQLIEDMEIAKVSKSISETFLNAALYGIGISKLVVEDVEEFATEQGTLIPKQRIQVSIEPVSPFEAAWDPTARCIDEGLGFAHIIVKPMIDVIRKQEDGIYFDVPLGDFVDLNKEPTKEASNITDDKCELIEYHGLVPSIFLTDIEEWMAMEKDEDDDMESFMEELYEPEKTHMVEAIITIANRGALLKAVKNPFIHKDRSIIAFQYDTVPGKFVGRSVAEKAIQSQRALNAELRARQDGLALTIHPMMGVDATKIPRGAKFKVGPGMNLLSNGDPRATFFPMHFGEMSAHTYSEAGELERMLQMATGIMDSATPIGISPRNQTATGMSMISSGSSKRGRRTMRNLEVDYLRPLINKSIWRYQQFDPERYPYGDYKLIPFSTMGVMSREFEQGQIAQVLQATPDGPAKAVLLKGFVENSSIPVKNDFNAALEATFNPQPSPAQQMIEKLQLENAMLANEKIKMEIEKLRSEATENYAQAGAKTVQAQTNKFTAIAQVQDNELDRTAYGMNK